MSLRWSAALAAGSACAVVFGLGGLGMREMVHAGELRAAERATASELTRFAEAYRLGGRARDGAKLADVGLGTDAMFEVVTDSGEVVVRSPNLTRLDPSWVPLPPAPPGTPVDAPTTGTAVLRPGEHPDWREYRSYTVLGAVVEDVPADLVEPLGREGNSLRDGLSDATAVSDRHYRLTLHLFVPPWSAQSAARAVTRVLLDAIPLAVLFVALIAWVVTGRALRPVEAIRRELAGIGEHELDRRVPVPPSDDEVARLARTTNATLDRLADSLVRQRRFVADASHELRSPLASLRTGLEVALVHADRADWPTTAGRALADVQRLQDLAADLLLLAGNGSADPPPVEVDLADLVRTQVAEHTGPPAIRCLADGPAPVLGHPERLDRLLRNLLDNARRHATSAITATVRVSGGWVLLEVADDGPGIPAADRERVFERFTRLDDARTRDAGGSGLGLAIARDLAARHGGSLRVADTEGGAHLVARLPRAVPE
ncbi:HAMP domain-containing sensor histidine kinase [Actinosynnema sp. NPDC020468]|uniref:sensor histidine kinase n=1 Tax=Actinosynnema sp. NPDC020468 TaxID=3154488 RepID=UPI0033F7D9B9